MKTLYSIDEVVLIPSIISDVESRSQCNPTYDGQLPLFIAPMSCLTDEKNYKTLYKKGFNPIIPRNIPWSVREKRMIEGDWIAVGLDEGYKIVKNEKKYRGIASMKVCIDIANGHQRRSFDLCREMKKVMPQLTLMVGNIANPGAYVEYGLVGADYVRIGIGSGHVCTTSVQTGMHYPMASLISECNGLKTDLEWKMGRKAPAIVADGGFGYIDQIVKAIALGADYVMIGRIAASFPESCGDVVNGKREYYGMSTEKAQRLMHPEPDYVPKHTEGTVRWIPIIPSSDVWIDDFTHALKSSMSYANAFSLDEYRGQVEWSTQNPTTFNAYIKS